MSISTLTKYFTLDYYLSALGYTKASSMNLTRNQPTTDEDIEQINQSFIEETRKVIRWLGANNTDISAIVNADKQGVIGSSINIQSRIADMPDINNEIEDYIAEWCEFGNCETTSRWHFNSLLRSMVEFTDKDGGFLLRHHYNSSWDIPYKVELIEIGMIDVTRDDKNARVLNGLKKDRFGKVTGIYIYKDQERRESSFIPMKDLIFFSPVWISISQYTAISKFASFLPTIDNVGEYSDAELKSAISRAKAGKYWKTAMYDDILKIVKNIKDETVRKAKLSTLMTKITEQGVKPEGLTPIPHGDDVVNTDTPSASVYPNLVKNAKQDISASQGLASQIVYQDSSDSNYSSIKAMMAFASIQWNIRYDDLEAQVIKPILKNVINVGVLRSRINISDYFQNVRKYFKLEIFRVKEIDIEPAKTASADAQKLEIGSTSLREICRRRGRNYEDVLRERLEDELLEKTMRTELGLEVASNGTEN